ncbi:MAG: hypothetical protein DIU83_09675, partial [Bacillota bacterium]
MIGTVQTWETYAPGERRRALAESGLGPVEPHGPYHVALLEDWCPESLALLEDVLTRRGGVVRGGGRRRGPAPGPGALWRGLPGGRGAAPPPRGGARGRGAGAGRVAR